MNDAEVKQATADWYRQRDSLKTQFGKDSKQYKKFAASEVTVKGLQGATDSIMFTGQKVLPAHYLPIWSCLAGATREFVDPSEWAIV